MSVETDVAEQTAHLSAVGMIAVVTGKDPSGDDWEELGEVTSFSSTGATIRVPRECHVGRLIWVDLPFPPHMRAYDHDKEFYRVWGLVQNCHSSPAERGGASYVGIAFIGRNPPASYNADPQRSYRICGVNDDGLWKVAELKSTFKPRKELRYWEPFELYLAQVDANMKTINGAKGIAENISKGGAAVLSSLDLNVGDRVKFISEQFDYSGIAVVCDKLAAKESRCRLHLKFVESDFPVEKLASAQNK